VNGQPAKPTYSPRAGDQISVFWPEARPAKAEPEEIPLDVLYEDADLIAINKAPGIVVHPAAGNEQHTLVNALLHHCRGQLSGIGGIARPGIVHRLDKDTSGCLLAAKNDAAHQILAEQFAGRSIEKKYLAIVCGEITRESGEIRASIARHPGHRKRMTVYEEGGRQARTGYRVIERFGGATLVEITLHTGRTHQIRVHFEHLGFPVFGDEVYGKKQTRILRELRGFDVPRQLLHAHTVAFDHPRHGKRMHLKAPWPLDFADALKTLRAAPARKS
jgi:23S rRNA pseudouridine1911/1915/1917 synthase